jgi:hypothetical protein
MLSVGLHESHGFSDYNSLFQMNLSKCVGKGFILRLGYFSSQDVPSDPRVLTHYNLTAREILTYPGYDSLEKELAGH